jgi:hypothetical protein
VFYLIQAFEEFVSRGLDCKTWSKLETLVWVPMVPWVVANVMDTLSQNGRCTIEIPERHKMSVVSNCKDLDRDFRIHRVCRELMDTFPSIQKFAIWNWIRKGYDVMDRKSTSWTYWVALDDGEWMKG